MRKGYLIADVWSRDLSLEQSLDILKDHGFDVGKEELEQGFRDLDKAMELYLDNDDNHSKYWTKVVNKV